MSRSLSSLFMGALYGVVLWMFWNSVIIFAIGGWKEACAYRKASNRYQRVIGFVTWALTILTFAMAYFWTVLK